MRDKEVRNKWKRTRRRSKLRRERRELGTEVAGGEVGRGGSKI